MYTSFCPITLRRVSTVHSLRIGNGTVVYVTGLCHAKATSHTRPIAYRDGR